VSGGSLQARRAAAVAAQAELAAAKAPFAVIACPGAGKTRLIVDRHLTQPVPPRQGRAIVAFTRVAAAEVSRRCQAMRRLDLMDHPHFIGTLDTFLWVHLVRPFLPADRPWQRLESWRDAPAGQREFRCGGRSYRLDDVDFQVDAAGRWSANPKRSARRGPLPSGWRSRACLTRRQLAEAGYVTGAELRAHACTNLAAHGPRLAGLLAARYAEVIVDEAQDCAPVDLHILRQLHDLGVTVIVVADPDQAIYGFRGSATEDLAAFVDRLGRRELTSNWRSTAAICRAAATLRTSGRSADTAVADHHAEPVPVLLYSAAALDAAVADYLAYANGLGIATGDCLILAYARSSLPRGYAGPAEPPRAEIGALAWAVGILTEFPAAPEGVHAHARDILTRTMLRWWYDDADAKTVLDSLAAHGVDPATVDRLRCRLLAAMPSLDQPLASWSHTAAQVLTAHPLAPGLTRTRKRLAKRAGKAATARDAAGLPARPAAGGHPRLTSIHQAKGDQVEAVLVCVPNTDRSRATMHAWLTGTPSQEESAEALRVLYVAVTRARRLLGLIVPSAYLDELAAHLRNHGVPVECRPPATTTRQ
jgi:hypothetical protein